MKEILELVKEQAEDEGLWFLNPLCSEAYLQAALRELHAAIEAYALSPAKHPSAEAIETKGPSAL